MFGPGDFIDYLKAQGLWRDFPTPVGTILFYQRWFLERVVAHEAEAGRLLSHELPRALLSFHLVRAGDLVIGLSGGFGIGSPAAAAVMEELTAAGVGKFISVGTAGGLQKDLRIGDVVVCDRAIRDEGVSHHYLAPAKFAHTSAALTGRLGAALTERGVNVRVGTTWTVDAPYRETVEELKHYQSEGVLTVDMEAAALAAVAEHRGVEFTAAFSISDTLADLVWDPQFRSKEVLLGLDRLYAAATEALL